MLHGSAVGIKRVPQGVLSQKKLYKGSSASGIEMSVASMWAAVRAQA